MKPYAVYIRRSMKKEGDADVSDQTQEATARSRLPEGAEVLVLTDSGGHHSGFSDQRPGYQRLLELVRTCGIAGVAAYDDSRLNRNAEHALALYRECMAAGVLILTGAPAETLFGSGGKLTYGVQAIVAEHYRNQQSERMKAMFAQTFATGGHRGHDPFGYRTQRDALGRVAHPRRLVVVPEQAEVVRRVFAELTTQPFSTISDMLNVEAALRPAKGHGGAWTADAVKAIWDRRFVYLGFAVLGHQHADRRPGTHDPIITEEELRAALTGVEARKRGRGASPPSSRRVYLLRGLMYCSCGTRMRGDARVHHGREYRYYACPVSDGRGRWLTPTGEQLSCNEHRLRAELAESEVLDAVKTLVLPPEVIEAARDELADRLRLPAPGLTDGQRAKLERRIENLRKQHEWGDLSDEEYRRSRDDVERQLILLPDSDKLITFDRCRDILISMAENVDRATTRQRQALVEMLVERVATSGRAIVDIVWTSAARPFFGLERAAITR